MSHAQVDPSRRVCDSVAKGELDVAIIGGEVPPDLAASVRAVTYAEDQLVCIYHCHYTYSVSTTVATVLLQLLYHPNSSRCHLRRGLSGVHPPLPLDLPYCHHYTVETRQALTLYVNSFDRPAGVHLPLPLYSTLSLPT